jgi:hypothetical protein
MGFAAECLGRHRFRRTICGRNGRPRQTVDRAAAGSRQLIEQRLGVFQVGGVEALVPLTERRQSLQRIVSKGSPIVSGALSVAGRGSNSSS